MNEKNTNLDSFDINQYLKYSYGVTDKELKDLHKFADTFIDLMDKFLEVKNKDFVKKIIAQFNLFPAYGGFAIFEIVNFNKELALENFCIEILNYYNANKKTEQGTDFIKDLNEIISSLYFFSPEATLRKILIKNEENIFNYLITECKNRSAIYSMISCRYADLYLASKKTNEKYISRIVEFFNILEAKVIEANNIIPEIPDALNIALKDIKKLTFAFKDENKKTSLDQLKIILTRKIEMGNLIYHLIIGNESAIEAVFSSSSFPNEIIKKSLSQMKLQQLLEIAIFLQNTNAIDQYKIVQEYLENTYKILPSMYISQTRELAPKYDSSKFGILIRNAMMMPVEDEAKDANEAITEMLSKLSTLANNLTAFASQASLSISVVLISKTNLFSIFLKEYEEKKNGTAGAFAAKLQDKDFMKKIKESDLSSMTFDQMTCKNIICILAALKEAIAKDFKIAQKEEAINKAFSVLVKKYKIILSKKVFLRFVDIFFSKIPSEIMS